MATRDWFAPKRFGYGAGLPIAWQGWAALATFFAVALAVMALSPRREVTGATIGLDMLWLWWITARHTRGGLRWRWGGDR